MPGVRERGERIRAFIMETITGHPSDLVALTASKFGISRQAASTHVRKLISQKAIIRDGSTRQAKYRLNALVEEHKIFAVNGLEEDRVLREFVRPILGGLPDNVLDIWSYGFTEMLNNAIDHSCGKSVSVIVKKYPIYTEIVITDDGIGIFRKIKQLLNLTDESHAILELSKGKLTTDPDRHTGEGIFFSSRVFDEYIILSGNIFFSHEYNKPEDWIIERNTPSSGTAVFMKLSNNSSRKIKSIFDEFTGRTNYGFNKTVVPVSLARYGNENLVSRSQAKRLLARIEKFKIVIFDFDGIDQIGQAFADEVFRVFKKHHPDIQLYFVKTCPQVESMIIRALGADS